MTRKGTLFVETFAIKGGKDAWQNCVMTDTNMLSRDSSFRLSQLQCLLNKVTYHDYLCIKLGFCSVIVLPECIQDASKQFHKIRFWCRKLSIEITRYVASTQITKEQSVSSNGILGDFNTQHYWIYNITSNHLARANRFGNNRTWDATTDEFASFTPKRSLSSSTSHVCLYTGRIVAPFRVDGHLPDQKFA